MTPYPALLAVALLAGCTGHATPLEGNADLIVVEKAAHRMTLMRGGQPLKTYTIALGRGGLGAKERAGDRKTPEGRYRITAHNPASVYHLSLRIGYPTADQQRAARASQIDPGGDIMIHGLPNGRGWMRDALRNVDWTDGCIALTDAEIEEVAAHVPDGTPIDIRP